MSEYVKIGVKIDFPNNRTKAVKIGEREVCVANNKGALSAFDDRCTHADAMLSDCAVRDGELTCPLHGARFDVSTGNAKTLPATEPLTLHDIKIEGSDVWVRLNETE